MSLSLTDLPAFLISLAGLFLFVLIGEVMHRRAGWAAENSRRGVHFMTGLFVFVTPWIFEGPGWVYVLALGFVGVNFVAVRRRWLKGMHGIRRRSWGTVTFPLALLLALVVAWSLEEGRVFALQTAFLVLALADPLASVVGETIRHGRRFQIGGSVKTQVGTLTFALTTFCCVAAVMLSFRMAGILDWPPETLVGAALAVALTATAAEALSGNGWDNLFIVVAVLFPLVYLHDRPDAIGGLLLAAAVAVAFGGLAMRLRFLDPSGSVSAGLLAFSVVGLGGWAWAVPGFAFFFLSSLLSKWGRAQKEEAEALSEKGSRRDAGQVFANGGVAWALLLVQIAYPLPVFYWGFLGAFAAAAADTWATEIGTFVKGPTRSIVTGKPVVPGESGGVSIAGLMAALAGAGAVWMAAVFVGSEWVRAAGFGPSMLAVVGGGFGAALIDSLLGATLQARYLDVQTGRLTERPVSGYGLHPRVRGYTWITNDVVNVFCTVAGALLAMAVVLGAYGF